MRVWLHSLTLLLSITISACTAPRSTVHVSASPLRQPSRAERAAPPSAAPSAPVMDAGISCIHVFQSLPRSLRPDAAYAFLENDSYAVGFSLTRKEPLWAAYCLKSGVVPHSVTRPKNKRFDADARVAVPLTHDDYTNSGFDRGHMAPSDAIGQWYGDDAQISTFIVTNICPQAPSLNQQTWAGLETAETAVFARMDGQTYVICGPIFGPTPQVIGTNHVAVPDAFYRVIVHSNVGHTDVLALVLPQSVGGQGHTLSEFVVTVDQIEASTGLDFFAALPDDLEERLESTKADAGAWPLNLVLSRAKILAGVRDVEQ